MWLDGVEARVNGMFNMYLEINALERFGLQKSGQRAPVIYRSNAPIVSVHQAFF